MEPVPEAPNVVRREPLYTKSKVKEPMGEAEEAVETQRQENAELGLPPAPVAQGAEVNPGLDARAGEMPKENAEMLSVLVAAFRELAAHAQIQHRALSEVLQTHMARQNMLLDKIVFTQSVGNAALSAMLGADDSVPRAMFNSQVSQMQATRQKKIKDLQAKIEEARNQPSEV